jgi:mono/diheme cytochrome c family protein
MLRRASPTRRGFVFTVLLLPAEWAGMVACRGDGAASQPQTQAQTDAGPGLDASATDAGCAVDSGALDGAQVALGQQIVGARNCSKCHGENFEGNFDGVPSPTTEGGTAYPPNLTSDPATGLGCWTDPQIENAILNGIDNQGMLLCPPMPRWGQIDDGGLDAAAAWAVVQFLRSLPIAPFQVPNTPNCAQLDAETDASAD